MDTALTAAREDVSLFDDTSLDNVPAQQAAFDDGKDPQALRTIGEVAKALDIRPHVLRYWEEQFPALQPIKRSGNRRYYRPEDIALIGEIDRLVHGEGYTLRGAAKAIDDKSLEQFASNSPGVNGITQESPGSNFLSKLAGIRGALATALERA